MSNYKKTPPKVLNNIERIKKKTCYIINNCLLCLLDQTMGCPSEMTSGQGQVGGGGCEGRKAAWGCEGLQLH